MKLVLLSLITIGIDCKKLFAKMRKETGLEQENLNFVQYSARHTKITNFAKANHNASKIQKWAGHSKFETTKPTLIW